MKLFSWRAQQLGVIPTGPNTLFLEALRLKDHLLCLLGPGFSFMRYLDPLGGARASWKLASCHTGDIVQGTSKSRALGAGKAMA